MVPFNLEMFFMELYRAVNLKTDDETRIEELRILLKHNLDYAHLCGCLDKARLQESLHYSYGEFDLNEGGEFDEKAM